MADAEAATTTPLSTAEPLLKARKDRQCPFCSQAFTSSSLGRHLDLYIRPKNPKESDGVHLVDEIRKLRGNITRRQIKPGVSTPRRGNSAASTRTSTAKKQRVASQDSSLLAESPEAEDDDVNGDDDDDDDDDTGLHVTKIRRPSKHSSRGNGSRPPPRVGAKTPETRRDVSRQLQKSDLDQRQRLSNDAETTTATEMALRELLRSVRDASSKLSGAGLFDFDPYALNFPALVLRILPAPATLFSPTPFPTSESWSVAPPAHNQVDALNRQVRERLLAYQRQRQISQIYPSGALSDASAIANSPLPTPPPFDADPQRLFGHIADAYTHWTQQTDKTRLEYWHIELLRCYARADDRRREAEMQLENARREIEFLKSDRRASGAPELSPISINFGTDTTKELEKHGMDFRNWNYDRLIEKWRTVIRGNKKTSSGLVAQKPLPAAQTFTTINQSRQGSPIKVENTMPFTAPPTVNGDAGSDQVDAEGDDDEEDIDVDVDVNSTPQTVSDKDSMHQIQVQQSHIRPLLPAPTHSSQHLQAHIQRSLHVTQAQAQQAQAQAQAQAHAQAQAQAWAAARQHFQPHQHQQLSPHVQHIRSATNSRRPSLAMMDPHAINSLNGPMGITTGMDCIEGHQTQFLGMDMGLSSTFVGPDDGSISMGT